jgi:hypothetical protein
VKQATSRVDRHASLNWIARALQLIGGPGPADDTLPDRDGFKVRRQGLTRTYRHPWFDHLVPCPDCLGAGCEAYYLPPCPSCAGKGRILRLPEPAAAGAP